VLFPQARAPKRKKLLDFNGLSSLANILGIIPRFSEFGQDKSSCVRHGVVQGPERISLIGQIIISFVEIALKGYNWMQVSNNFRRWIKMNAVLLTAGLIIVALTELSSATLETKQLPQLAQNTRSFGYVIGIMLPAAGFFTFPLLLLKLDK
jgi:hypothetical protein